MGTCAARRTPCSLRSDRFRGPVLSVLSPKSPRYAAPLLRIGILPRTAHVGIATGAPQRLIAARRRPERVAGPLAVTRRPIRRRPSRRYRGAFWRSLSRSEALSHAPRCNLLHRSNRPAATRRLNAMDKALTVLCPAARPLNGPIAVASPASAAHRSPSRRERQRGGKAPDRPRGPMIMARLRWQHR